MVGYIIANYIFSQSKIDIVLQNLQIHNFFSPTFSVIQRVHVSADVTLQIAVKVGSRGKESQTDGHQLPASLQTVVAEVLCSLSTQLDVKLIPQPLVTPSTHHHLPQMENYSGKRFFAFVEEHCCKVLGYWCCGWLVSELRKLSHTSRATATGSALERRSPMYV